jgi:DNA repair protein SbcC/Rad50
VFERREAAVKTRDAEFAANLVVREGLIQALSDLAADLPEAELKRALAEHDQQWRQAPEVLRVQMPKLEARWQAAREKAAHTLASSGQRRWLAHVDALVARLALCRERETEGADADALAARWKEAAETAPNWLKALAPRWQQPVGSGPLSAGAVEALLLQLEASLDLPATPEQQAARRQLKLQAMKQALEGRGGAGAPKSAHEAFAALLRQARLDPAQAQRLDVLVAGLRGATPGTFV